MNVTLLIKVYQIPLPFHKQMDQRQHYVPALLSYVPLVSAMIIGIPHRSRICLLLLRTRLVVSSVIRIARTLRIVIQVK